MFQMTELMSHSALQRLCSSPGHLVERTLLFITWSSRLFIAGVKSLLCLSVASFIFIEGISCLDKLWSTATRLAEVR